MSILFRAAVVSLGLLLLCMSPLALAADDRALSIVFGAALRQIDKYYLEPVSFETLAIAGISGLDATNKIISAKDHDHTIVLMDRGESFASIALPQDEADGWAKLLVTAIAASRSHVPSLAASTDDDIATRVIKGMVASLDRFSHYADPQQARELRRTRNGFGGVGITLDYTGSLPTVTTIAEDGTALQAGLEVGDHLISVDGEALASLDQRQIADLLRGPVDSFVRIVFTRLDRHYVARLRRIQLIGVTVKTEIQGDIAIFHVHGFNAQTTSDLETAIDLARMHLGDKLTGAILDMRDNLGGLLDQGVSVASLFLANGVVSTTSGRLSEATQRFPTTGHDHLAGVPLVVLVNSETASSAEIVAAALQDLGRAVVVGTASFGKGTVQILLELPNGGEFALTWARLYAPSGYQLQGHGVVPLYCTSHLIDPLGQPQPVEAGAVRIIQATQHQLDTGPRRLPASLSDSEWIDARAGCAAQDHDPALDIPVAARLLHDPALYARSLIPLG